MMLRQDRWTFGISVVVLALACVCVAQAASAQTTGSVVQWGNATEWDLPTPNENFTAIAAGWTHSLGLRPNGSIATWGRNYGGECDVPPPNRHFVAVAADYRHSLGLKKDGSIVTWGLNWLCPEAVEPSDPPVGPCDVPEPNDGFTAIATGAYHSLGLKEGGRIVAWGWNDYGQCDVPEPNDDFIAISAGYYHSLGLTADGSIKVWGSGQESYSVDPPPNTEFVAISAGYCLSLGLDSDGSITAWGYIGAPPEPNTGFVAIAAGYEHALGLRGDGTVVAWGGNHIGQCDVPPPNENFFAIEADGHQSLGLRVVEEPPPPETGEIAGRVIGPDGDGVKRALVWATGGGKKLGTYSTGKQGSYSITLPAGVLYTVDCMKDGVGYDVVYDVPVIAGETTVVDLYLQP